MGVRNLQQSSHRRADASRPAEECSSPRRLRAHKLRMRAVSSPLSCEIRWSGLNYAYYEPPGAQALHNNPLFVRSHDFAGETVEGMKTLWQAPELMGQGFSRGRRGALCRLARRSALCLGRTGTGFYFAGQRSGV